MEIVLATQNVHKIREFREMMHLWLHIDLLSLINFPNYVPIEETGSTFKENAELKAKHAAITLNKWVLADDSGLVVPALNGAPGVKSRRYASEDATDSENRQKLLDEMEKLEKIDRCAYYECHLALANPEGDIIKSVSGICEGEINLVEKGRNGFGYDALFKKNDYEKTFAELDESVKIRISHRRKALEKLLGYLETLVATKA